MPRVRPKKKKGTTRGPPSTAGLVSFLNEETKGIKIGPYSLLFLTVIFIITIILLWWLQPPVG